MSQTFTVYNNNMLSMASKIKPGSIATFAQIALVQKFVYNFAISVMCYYYRADMCDLLAELNRLAQAGQLPIRTYKKGKGYLSATGVMKFRNAELKAYKSQEHICLTYPATLLVTDQCATINRVLRDSWTGRGYTSVFYATLLPAPETEEDKLTLDDIVLSAKKAVATYKCTFDLNKPLQELKASHTALTQAITSGKCKVRETNRIGETYIDENKVIRFRVLTPQTEPVHIAPQVSSAKPEVTSSHVEEPYEEERIAQIIEEATVCVAEPIHIAPQVTDEIIYISDAKLSADKKTKTVWYGNMNWQKPLTVGARVTVVETTKAVAALLTEGILMVDKKAQDIDAPVQTQVVSKTALVYSKFNKLCKSKKLA